MARQSDPRLKELEEKLSDQRRRLNSLYAVLDEAGKEVAFRMRPVQEELYDDLWYLNLVLKSRQHGITTLMCLYALDLCIFNSGQHAHIIAHTREDSERIFTEKIKYPYERLPAELRQAVAATEDNARVLRFKNGSTISCGSSMRGGTLQFLHISEHGKICAKYPDKAREIRTGALNTVHPGQMIVIESTAEGKQGDFYEYTKRARALAESGRDLGKLDFRFFFFPWWRDPKNALDPRTVVIDDELAAYFEELEVNHGIRLTPGQKAWYSAKYELNRDLMFREHPSTPDEAFQGAIEGSIYGRDILRARREGRILPEILPATTIPCFTTWDLGKNDETAIWVGQQLRSRVRWLWYYENRNYGPDHYVAWLDRQREKYGIRFTKHYLPHDVGVSDLSQPTGVTRKDVLEEMGLTGIEIVPRVPNINDGIAAVRRVLPVSEFSESGCRLGLERLETYQYEMDPRTESLRDTPRHDQASNGADAIRQFCQAYEPEMAYRQTRTRRRERNWRVL